MKRCARQLRVRRAGDAPPPCAGGRAWDILAEMPVQNNFWFQTQVLLPERDSHNSCHREITVSIQQSETQ